MPRKKKRFLLLEKEKKNRKKTRHWKKIALLTKILNTTIDYSSNTNLRYLELGDFAVFMMDINGSSARTQLYVTYASHSGNYEDGIGDDIGNAPEPATLLLWSLGSVGALEFRHYRKRSKTA